MYPNIKDRTPLDRAKLLESTPLFANVHAEEAGSGQSAVPTNLDTDYHFTCFVEAPSAEPGHVKGEKGHRLVELDGRRAGPIARGLCTDLLKVWCRFLRWSKNTNVSYKGRRGIYQGKIHIGIGQHKLEHDCTLRIFWLIMPVSTCKNVEYVRYMRILVRRKLVSTICMTC